MYKILMLSPCLMLDNNRDYNVKCKECNLADIMPDAYAVYDQCFHDFEYDSRVTYIGHQKERRGWVVSRNALLKYFYASDYDYCFWIDANSTVSKPCLNDLQTILKGIRDGELLQCDTIFSTLGLWCSQERVDVKRASDYFDNVHILPVRGGKAYNWMHGLIHKNFKKFYNQEFYIDERCDTNQGIAEDVYFSRLLKSYTNAYLAPTICVNKPDSNKSCDRNDGTGRYTYPPVKYDVVDNYILENSRLHEYRHTNPNQVRKEIILPRVAYMKDTIKPYKPRTKVSTVPVKDARVSLF